MPDLKISLIIPAYNEEKYIGTCLQYALRNKEKFHEIIVVDNNSTDRTKEVAQGFDGVKVIEEKKKGVTKARQRGVEEATGDILAFADADTQMTEIWPDTIREEFTKNPKLVCLSGPYLYYDFKRWLQIVSSFFWYIIAIPMSWMVGYMAIAGNLAIRKDTLDKMGGLDTTIIFYGDDTDTVRRAKKFGQVKFSRKLVMPTSCRRFSSQGIFNTNSKYFLNFFAEVFFHRPVTKEYKDFR
jgi:glycosyltransferase involved in cell wall biosynthesis